MAQIISKIKQYFLKILIIQILVTLISLPILILWGIPISKMTLIGNIIFMPFLAIFITLSSLIFFTELLNIPNKFLIILLEKLTYYWDKLLSLGQKSWLICFKTIPILILLTIPICVYLILKNKYLNNIPKKLICSFITLSLYLIIFSYPFTANNKSSQEYLLDNKLEINQKKGILTINDNNAFNRKKSIRKYLDFELKPHLIKKYGSIKIKTLSILKPCASSFKAALEFCDVFDLEKIQLPFFNGEKLNKYGWKQFFLLKEAAQKNNTNIIRYKYLKKLSQGHPTSPRLRWTRTPLATIMSPAPAG